MKKIQLINGQMNSFQNWNGQKILEETFDIFSHKEMQIKRALRFHLTLIRMSIIKKIINAGENVGKKEPLYIVGEIVN
jgi:hypothetical protein